ncbi:MAG: sulfotransferase [Pirellulales bacterium]|nr:sulfotransferase [Pirellulales bacterium]
MNHANTGGEWKTGARVQMSKSERDERLQLQLKQALMQHQAGEVTSAEEGYRAVLQEDSANLDALHLLGMLCHETGRPEDARRWVGAAVALRPDLGVLRNSLGVILLAQGDLGGAKECFESAVERSPELAEAHRNLGLVCRNLGWEDLAVGHYENALRQDPHDTQATLELASLAENRQDWWTAESLIRQAMSRQPAAEQQIRLATFLGRMWNGQRHWQQVIDWLFPFADAPTANGPLWLQLGMALGQAGRHQDAFGYLARAATEDPESFASHLNLSASLLALGKTQESFQHATIAHELSPGVSSTRQLARVLQSLGDVKKACALVQSQLETVPEDVELMEQLAGLEHERGNLDTAIDLLRRALDIAPARRQTLFKLANLCEQSERVDRVVEACVSVLRTNPDAVAAHLLLGLVLSSRLSPRHRAKMNLDERDALLHRALNHLCRAASLEPSAETYDAWGKTLAQSGDHDSATERLSQAIALNPDFAPAHCSLGKAYLELGKLELAEASFQNAVSLDPTSADAQYELSRLQSCQAGTAQIEQLRSLVDDHRLPASQRTLLGFALARRYDAIGDYDAAFENYANANRLKPPAETGQVEAFSSQATDQLLDVFGQDDFGSDAEFGSEDETPIFIVGMPRSGTTLVEQILSNHPRVFGAGELNDISDLANSLSRRLGTTGRYPQNARKLDGKTARWLAEEYLNRLQRLVERDACESLRQEVDRVTDKMPTNFRHLGFIAKLFPRARIVHLQRNPLDVCVSCFKQNLAWPFCDLDAVADYIGEYRRMMEHWENVLPNKIFHLRYEDLVQDASAETRHLFEYCGLSWDAAYLEFQQSGRAVQTPSKWQVRQPLYQTSVGTWRRYQRHLQKLIDRFGMPDQ